MCAFCENTGILSWGFNDFYPCPICMEGVQICSICAGSLDIGESYAHYDCYRLMEKKEDADQDYVRKNDCYPDDYPIFDLACGDLTEAYRYGRIIALAMALL